MAVYNQNKARSNRCAGHAAAGHPAEPGSDRALIADIVLQLLSYVAQTEREFIRQRQAEGIAAAKLKGVRFGRPEKKLPDSFQYAVRAWENGEKQLAEILSCYHISEATFYRHLRKYRREKRQ